MHKNYSGIAAHEKGLWSEVVISRKLFLIAKIVFFLRTVFFFTKVVAVFI